jgi:hypothetical protein
MATIKEIQLVKEISGLSVEINCIGKYSAFMSFSGHVGLVEVHLGGAGDDYSKHVAGWRSSYDNQIYLSDNEWRKAKDCVKNLESLRDRLVRIRDGVDKPEFLADGAVESLPAVEELL